jgi:NADH-quinone oxidoreductase subunit A
MRVRRAWRVESVGGQPDMPATVSETDKCDDETLREQWIKSADQPDRDRHRPALGRPPPTLEIYETGSTIGLESRSEACGVVSDYFAGYSTVGVLLLVGVGFVTVALAANRLLRPAGRRGGGRPSGSSAERPSATDDTYECGIAIDPVDRAWAQTQIRYYVYAFVYVVFAVETVFVYPWATIFAKPGYGAGALAEMGVFVGLLTLGLLYAWRKRVLVWT